MTTDPSSLRIFASFAKGSESAADRLFQRYVNRLSQLARSRLTPRVASRVDPEDIVMSAWRSFFVGSRKNQFAVNRSGDLWALLTRITLYKLYRTVERHTAQRRSVNQETSALSGTFVSDREPAPDEAVALSDYVEQLLGSLGPRDRRIAELRLQGEFMDNIAVTVGCSEKTVRRSLAALRAQLADAAGESPHPFTEGAKEQLLLPAADVSELPPDLPQISFSDLTLTRMIGQGGMGKVYRADLLSTTSSVAVKFLHRAFQQNSDAVKRLLTEAEIVHRLNHPGIVGLQGIGRTQGGIYFLVMNILDGVTLAEQRVTPTLDQSIQWMDQLADALAHAHKAGIVHCDLKPSNVMICRGRAVLTDFGLAHILSAERDRAMSGTAPWMAPEQIDKWFGPVSPATDVYGLGALMYTLLAGRPPFVTAWEAENRMPRAADILCRVVASERPEVPNREMTNGEQRLFEVCLACLSREPARRPDSAAAFRHLLTAQSELR